MAKSARLSFDDQDAISRIQSSRMNPDTGELELVYSPMETESEETATPEPPKTEKTQEAKTESPPKQTKKKARDPIEIERKRRKDAQAAFTRVSQRAAQQEKRLKQLERRLEEISKVGENEFPAPEEVDLMELFSGEGEKALDWLRRAVQHFAAPVVEQAVGDRLDTLERTFRPIQQRISLSQSAYEFSKQHPDVVHWSSEMRQIIREAGDDEDLSLEDIYLRARELNPEKAERIDAGEFDSDEEISSDTQDASEEQQDDAESESSNEPESTESSEEEEDVSPEELRQRAARLTTESSVHEGDEPQVEIRNPRDAIRASLEELGF